MPRARARNAEAPWISKWNGTYYLSYMTQKQGAHFGFDIGYGVSTSGPLGPYVHAGTVMWSPPWDCGPRPGTPSLCTRTNNNGDNNHQGEKAGTAARRAAASTQRLRQPLRSTRACLRPLSAGSFTLGGRTYMAYHNRKVAVERGEYQGYQRK